MTINWTPEMEEEFRRKREEGAKILDCGNAVGVSYETAFRYARRKGLSARLNQGRRPGHLAVLKEIQ